MSDITIDDIQYISKQPRINGKVIIDDWELLLKFEYYNIINSFEQFNINNEWIAPLSSQGQKIIQNHNELNNVKNIEEFFNKISN